VGVLPNTHRSILTVGSPPRHQMPSRSWEMLPLGQHVAQPLAVPLPVGCLVVRFFAGLFFGLRSQWW
jgi:hypothetical protein